MNGERLLRTYKGIHHAVESANRPGLRLDGLDGRGLGDERLRQSAVGLGGGGDERSSEEGEGRGTDLVDVGQNTTACNGRADQDVEFLVTTNGELEVAGRDSLNLKVLGGVAC